MGLDEEVLFIVRVVEVDIYHVLHEVKMVPHVDQFASLDGLVMIGIPDHIPMVETQWGRYRGTPGVVIALPVCWLTVLVHPSAPDYGF
jgi:hypothetical protein